MKTINRCVWVPAGNVLYEKYHDEEWGRPVHDDKKLFEFLILESAQAGLSWATILKKRENYRRAFAGFNPQKVAKFGRREIERLMKGDQQRPERNIVRNRAKIEAAVSNARVFLSIQREFGSFSKYMWSFVGGRPLLSKKPIKKLSNYPKFTPEAEAFSADLKRRGFRFFGPTVAYAHMQAVGMVNDHMAGCFLFLRQRVTLLIAQGLFKLN